MTPASGTGGRGAQELAGWTPAGSCPLCPEVQQPGGGWPVMSAARWAPALPCLQGCSGTPLAAEASLLVWGTLLPPGGSPRPGPHPLPWRGQAGATASHPRSPGPPGPEPVLGRWPVGAAPSPSAVRACWGAAGRGPRTAVLEGVSRATLRPPDSCCPRQSLVCLCRHVDAPVCVCPSLCRHTVFSSLPTYRHQLCIRARLLKQGRVLPGRRLQRPKVQVRSQSQAPGSQDVAVCFGGHSATYRILHGC